MKSKPASTEQLKILSSYDLDVSRIRGVTICEYERGEYICLEGCPLETLLIIIAGKAKVSFTAGNGKSLLMGFNSERGVIGDLEFMTGADNAYTNVQAVSPMFCLSIPVAMNGAYLRNNARFLMLIGNELAMKLTSSPTRCAQIILYPLQMRLCSYIIAEEDNGCFGEKLTETAELLGTSYRHLMRALSQLRKKKIIEKRGRVYYILDRDALNKGGMGIYN